MMSALAALPAPRWAEPDLPLPESAGSIADITRETGVEANGVGAEAALEPLALDAPVGSEPLPVEPAAAPSEELPEALALPDRPSYLLQGELEPTDLEIALPAITAQVPVEISPTTTAANIAPPEQMLPLPRAASQKAKSFLTPPDRLTFSQALTP